MIILKSRSEELLTWLLASLLQLTVNYRISFWFSQENFYSIYLPTLGCLSECHTGIQPVKSNVFVDNSGLYANWLCLINRITYFCTQEWRSIVLGVKRKSQKCWRVNNQLTFRQIFVKILQIFVKILQIYKPC